MSCSAASPASAVVILAAHDGNSTAYEVWPLPYPLIGPILISLT